VTAEVVRLRAKLDERQARLVSDDAAGAFGQLVYHLGDLVFQLTSEYGAWRVNVGLGDGALFPASFWIAALDGGDTFPDPPVSDEDIDRLTERLAELIDRAQDVSERVAAIGEQYSRTMRERFS
jgi:hypothetical protein